MVVVINAPGISFIGAEGCNHGSYFAIVLILFVLINGYLLVVDYNLVSRALPGFSIPGGSALGGFFYLLLGCRLDGKLQIIVIIYNLIGILNNYIIYACYSDCSE